MENIAEILEGVKTMGIGGHRLKQSWTVTKSMTFLLPVM